MVETDHEKSEEETLRAVMEWKPKRTRLRGRSMKRQLDVDSRRGS